MICNKKVTCISITDLAGLYVALCLMRNKNVFSIAALLGWTVSVKYVDGSLFFDFHRKTLSGVPFSFTAEMKDRKLENLIKEIESFVDAIDLRFVPGNG